MKENLREEDIHGSVLLALNDLSNMSDDLYSMLGDDVEITEDEHDAILTAYDLISEIHDKYDDHFEMPSQSYDPEDWDSEDLDEETEINEGIAWRMMIKTLTDLGFKKTEPSKDTWQPITPKREVDHMFGIPMRAGKWADTFFVIFADDDKPYCIIDSEGRTNYEDLGKALADLKKRAKMNEDTLDEAAKKFKFNPGKHEVQVSSKRTDGMFSITVVDKATNSKVLHRMRHELPMAKEGGEAYTAGSRVIDAKRVLASLSEDVSIDISEGLTEILPNLKKLGFNKRPPYKSDKKIKNLYVRPGDPSGHYSELYVGEYENETKPYFISHANGKDTFSTVKELISNLDKFIKEDTLEDKAEYFYENIVIAYPQKNESIKEKTNMIIVSENTLMVENDDSTRIKNIMESICEYTNISISEDNEELVFDTKEQCTEASLMLKHYFEILGEQNEIIDLNTISEEFDENKFRRLAIAGLVSDTDVAKIIRAMKDLQAGKTLDTVKKNLIASTFMNLVGLVTGDTSVFSKIQTAVKKEIA